jgi:hypothetical protein
VTSNELLVMIFILIIIAICMGVYYMPKIASAFG